MYVADRGLSPSDIEKYDVSAGTPAYLYDSPYHGDFPMCGNLWMSEDGARIFTACGNVFRSSVIRAQDMTYNGSLGISGIVSVVHSAEQAQVLAISSSDTAVQLYDYEFLTLNSTIPLPQFATPNGDFAAHGKFVFYNTDGTKYFVIVQADQASGMLNDYGVVTFGETVPVPMYCEIRSSQPTYVAGETVIADRFSIANLSDTTLLVEWKVWLHTPGPTYRILSAGDNMQLALPVGYSSDFGPLNLFTVAPNALPGRYTLGCRVLHPVTGEELGSKTSFFDVISAP